MVLKNLLYCLIVFAVFGCNCRSNKETIISSIVISHEECTDCFDANVESGDLFIPDSIEKLVYEKEKKTGIKVSRKTLILEGEGNISEELFGNQDDFTEKWNRIYEVDGFVTGFRNGALVFYVNNHKVID